MVVNSAQDHKTPLIKVQLAVLQEKLFGNLTLVPLLSRVTNYLPVSCPTAKCSEWTGPMSLALCQDPPPTVSYGAQFIGLFRCRTPGGCATEGFAEVPDAAVIGLNVSESPGNVPQD